ncbi:hypothetical protein KCP70_13735 [Salmonella enterica subsp. enterica]|nr:hypothetical protein KCP70_13735 [Salmonella enterica subsp. enterica]
MGTISRTAKALAYERDVLGKFDKTAHNGLPDGAAYPAYSERECKSRISAHAAIRQPAPVA